METVRWLGDALRRVVASAVATRPVPAHVAFIMDGNRRYAERQHLQIVSGHTRGYQRLIQALEWCLDLGITCVSVYAFSIDNFNRSAEEVATLMVLAEEKLSHMLAEQDVLRRHGVQVRVIGDLSLAPPGVRAAADRLMDATRHHSAAVLNICFAYTASRELQQAMDAAAGAQPLSPASLDDFLYTRDCPPVDLLVRTSGESRLSDFLLRQSSHALLVFTTVLWPDFSFLDLVAAVVGYQRSRDTIAAARRAARGAGQRAVLALRAPSAGVGLPPVKTRVEGDASESPCGVATPGSASTPSAASDASLSERAGRSSGELLQPLAAEEHAARLTRRSRKQLQLELEAS